MVELNVTYDVKDADKETKGVFNKLESGGAKVVSERKEEIGTGIIIIGGAIIVFLLLRD